MRHDEIQAINERVRAEGLFLRSLKDEMAHVIVGQDTMIDRLLMALLCDGHVLLEGVPGLAKTLTVSTLARTIQARFHRIQFTPDLLPADIVGTQIYNPKEGTFHIKEGPVFANLILADEINRAPAKVQSALLEAMQERQVTLGDETRKLESLFMVMATQNPIEQEGTYPLPEAQVDRFLMKLKVTYPSKEEEVEILRRMATVDQTIDVKPIVTPDVILKARKLMNEIYMDEKLQNYIVDIVMASRKPQDYQLDLSPHIQYGASPRATIYLALAAKAHAFLQGRGYVTPQDIKTIGMDVLRHRIVVTYEAEAEGLTSEDIVERILNSVEVP